LGYGPIGRLICLVLLLILTVALTGNARAQGIQFYSLVSKGGQVPAECMDAAKIIQPMLSEFGAPKQWTWIVVCDEASWRQVEVKTGQTNVDGTIFGLSNLDGHVTFIRGWAILHPFNPRPEYQPRHTIAHELGHILLHTPDEDKAEKKARELLKGQLVAVSR
jgi:hypothetical protein